ncbi:MAG: IS110 family transposase [Candidatus Competibacteraceae bacterium]|nr:IS110 family transposase [Candidatus Competibacteraceae bacterium]
MTTCTAGCEPGPVWRGHDELRQGVPGIGAVTSVTLLAALPELGTLDRRPIRCPRRGLPFDRDSGRCRGLRILFVSVPPLRTALYMATLTASRFNPVIKAFTSGCGRRVSRPR